MKFWKWILLAALCIAPALVTAQETTPVSVGTTLQGISVNVVGTKQGSGTIVLAKIGDQPATWILTANHVVSGLRSMQTIIDPEGNEKKMVTYRDAQVVQEQVQGGRGVGEIKYDAKVINVDPQRDIALLRVRRDSFTEAGAVFYLDNTIPPPGTALYHCGAPGGREIGGTCSLTSGIVSRLGVRIPEFGGSQHGIFDQATCPALGGSSGGLVALEADGRFVGMITLGLSGGAADSFHWMVPVRSIREWSKEIKAEWLLDPSVPRPTQAEVDAIPIELARPGAGAPPPTSAADTPLKIVPMPADSETPLPMPRS